MRAEGELTALTYRLPPEHSSQEAFAAARTSPSMRRRPLMRLIAPSG
ncbi:DUF4892 domain-containing protein [Pseudomonas aeruginosa]